MPGPRGGRKLRRDGEKEENAPGPVPGARADLSQPGHVAASEDGGGGLRVGPPGALPAHRAGLRARPLRHGVLRRPQLHRRHLYREPRTLAPQRGPGAGARPHSPPLLHRRGDGTDRHRLYVFGKPRPPVLRGAPLGDDRPPDARAGGLERGHLAQQQPKPRTTARTASRRRRVTTGRTSSWRSAAGSGIRGTRTRW